MNQQLRHALNAGITFGLVTIFLFLIGFTTTAADLLGDLLGNKNANLFLGLTPQMFNMLIFLALVGMWAGAYGARKNKVQTNDPWAPLVYHSTSHDQWNFYHHFQRNRENPNRWGAAFFV